MVLPPYSITWTVIPCLSHVVPFVGHMAIVDSTGVQYDFGGPYYVNRSRTETIFGEPCRYYQFDLTEEQRAHWDTTIHKWVEVYERQMYNFCSNNCHDFVVKILNEVGVGGMKPLGVVQLVAKYRFKMIKIKNFCC